MGQGANVYSKMRGRLDFHKQVLKIEALGMFVFHTVCSNIFTLLSLHSNQDNSINIVTNTLSCCSGCVD